MSGDCFTVKTLAVALQELPIEIQDYEVWMEADPSTYVGPQVPAWIYHERERVYL